MQIDRAVDGALGQLRDSLSPSDGKRLGSVLPVLAQVGETHGRNGRLKFIQKHYEPACNSLQELTGH